jgi:hypothetical protein
VIFCMTAEQEERARAWYKQQHSTNSPFSENTCIPLLAYNNGFINISCRQLSRERKIKSKSISIYTHQDIHLHEHLSLSCSTSLSFRCVLAYSRKRKKSTSAHHFTQDTQREMHFAAQQQQQPLFALARIGSKHFSAQSQVELKMLNFN